MNNKKWGVANSDSDLCYVVLWVSRNKDNSQIENFVERRKSFICTPGMIVHYAETFKKTFVNDGLPGELSRMYISVNARHMPTIRKQLMHFLIDDDAFNLCSIQSKIAGIAAQKECAAERKWMLDVDDVTEEQLNEIQHDMIDYCENAHTPINNMETYTTPHGYAVVIDHGFDCREFAEKWKEYVTIKKDDMLCLAWNTKEV